MTNDDKLELRVYAYNDPKGKALDVLPRRGSPQFLDEVSGVGAGQFTVWKQDKKLTDNPELLAYENVVKGYRYGKCEGAFVIQTKKDVTISTSEYAGKQITVSGEGLKTWFKQAVLYPYGGLKSQSPDERVFSFASEKGSWYKSSDWTPPVNMYQYEMLPPDSSTNPWKYQPADWPDAPDAYWVWQNKPASGYDVAQGNAYFRYEFDVAVAGSYSVFAAGDNTLNAWMDAGSIIEADGTTAYISTYRADMDLEAGHHVLAFKVTNTSVGPAGLIATLWRAGDADAGTAAQLISETGDDGWVSAFKAEGDPGWSIGEILLTMFSEAQSRNVPFTDWITPTFTGDADSNGVAWDRSLPWTFDIGSTYSDILDKFEEFYCDVWIDPDTLEWNAYAERGFERSVQTRTAQPVSFVEGKNLTAAENDGTSEVTNAMVLKTSDGYIQVTADDGDSQTKYGRRESLLSTGVNLTLSQQFAQKVFEEKQLPEEGATYTVVPRVGTIPFVDFGVGDWVLAPDASGASVRRRVVSLSSQEADDNAAPSYAIEFDTIWKNNDDELQKWLAIAQGGGLTGYSNSGSGGGGSSPTTSPIGGGTDYSSPPLPPTNLIATSSGFFNDNGGPSAHVTLTWDKVTNTVNGGTVPGVDYYEVWGREQSDPYGLRQYARVSGQFNTVTFDADGGKAMYFYVRASISSQRVSAFSDALSHTTALPNTPPRPPSKPVTASRLAQVIVTWDGKMDNGTAAPRELDYVYAMVSTTSGGTYTRSGSTTNAAGSIIISGLTIGNTYWIKLVAVNNLGLESTASAAASVYVDGVNADQISQDIKNDIDQAQQDAAQAVQDALDATNLARTAQTSADGKSTSYYTPDTPDVANPNVNDVWYDTDDGYKMYRWDGSQWSAAQLGTSAIADLAITGNKVQSLDAGKITTGTLDAARIAAGTITTRLLAVGDFTNIVSGSDWENSARVPWQMLTGMSLDTAQKHNGAQALKVVGQSSITTSNFTPIKPIVVPGDTLYYELWVYADSNYNGTSANAKFRIGDQSGNQLLSVGYGLDNLGSANLNKWYQISGVFTVPSGVTALDLRLVFNHTAGNIWVDDIVFRRQTNSTVIADGAITTAKIFAGSITGDKIAANTITAANITAGTITANEIKAGSITTVTLAANAITTDKLDALAITAKHTITGALIQTASSGARTEITSSGLRTLDASGNELVKIGYGYSTGMAVRNPQDGTMVPLAEHVFGVKTAGDFQEYNVSSKSWVYDATNWQVKSNSGRILVMYNLNVYFDKGTNNANSLELRPGHAPISSPNNYTTGFESYQFFARYAPNANYTPDSYASWSDEVRFAYMTWTPGETHQLGFYCNGPGAGISATMQVTRMVVLQA